MPSLAALQPLAQAVLALLGLCVLAILATALLWGWSASRRAARREELHQEPTTAVNVDPWHLAASRIDTPSADTLDRDRLNLEDTHTPLHDHDKPHHPDTPGSWHDHPGGSDADPDGMDSGGFDGGGDAGGGGGGDSGGGDS